MNEQWLFGWAVEPISEKDIRAFCREDINAGIPRDVVAAAVLFEDCAVEYARVVLGVM